MEQKSLEQLRDEAEVLEQKAFEHARDLREMVHAAREGCEYGHLTLIDEEGGETHLDIDLEGDDTEWGEDPEDIEHIDERKRALLWHLEDCFKCTAECYADCVMHTWVPEILFTYLRGKGYLE